MVQCDLDNCNVLRERRIRMKAMSDLNWKLEINLKYEKESVRKLRESNTELINEIIKLKDKEKNRI